MQVISDILLSGSTNNRENTVVTEEEFISDMSGKTQLLCRKYDRIHNISILIDKTINQAS